MHYSHELTVLPTNTIDNPVVKAIGASSGILTDMEVLFEVGDGFSTAVILCNRAMQLLPSNMDGFYTADGLLLHAPIYYNLDVEDNDLFLIAWNRGGDYSHSVNIMLSVRGNNEPDPNSIMVLMVETINRLISLMKQFI
ncbi:TPA_asm: hypothetical protein vir530_00002 [dsDNA virus vir530]|jgi:hypothetical protein|nr:TPA_asm: hypothetical protein vir530_00002 [dsDNA virus vir530]